MKRVRVVTVINGAQHFYQRHREACDPKTGQAFSQPYFVTDPHQSQPIAEDVARVFVRKLRNEFGVKDVWLEDVTTGEHIDVVNEAQQDSEDTRQPVVGTLNENDPDGRWYLLKPTSTPRGRKYFLRINVPGVPEPQVIYEDSPLAVLQRAEDLHWLQFAEQYIRPEPAQPAAQQTTGPRMRPGSFR